MHPVTHGTKFTKKLPSQKNTIYHVQPGKLPVNTVNYGKTAVTANLALRQILTDPVAVTISGHKLSMYWCLAGDECNGDGQMLVEIIRWSNCWQ